MAKDKRQYPRVEISWPATIITDDGLVSCRSENLSSEGTLIRCSEPPGSLDSFRLVFKPAERQLILATAEKYGPRALIVTTAHPMPWVSVSPSFPSMTTSLSKGQFQRDKSRTRL